MTEVMQSIPARLKNVAVGGHVAGADQIIDDEQNKTQETINSEVNTALGNKANKSEMSVTPGTGANVDKTTILLKSGTSATVLTQHQDISGKQDTINDLATIRSGAAAGATAQQPATTLSGYGITDAYTKSETYTKTEVNGLVDTPHQEYVTVNAYSALPATGSKDTIYRVSNYNGSTSQVVPDVYSEYAWDGTQYVFLCVKSQIGEVFDISVYNNNAKYTDLAAALNGGANIPQSLQKGGMSVKFVQSSDNKYIQARCMAQNFTTDVTQWQGVDDKPTAGSDNLVKSGGAAAGFDYIKAQLGGIIFGPVSVSTYYPLNFLKQGNTIKISNLITSNRTLYIRKGDTSEGQVSYVIPASDSITITLSDDFTTLFYYVYSGQILASFKIEYFGSIYEDKALPEPINTLYEGGNNAGDYLSGDMGKLLADQTIPSSIIDGFSFAGKHTDYVYTPNLKAGDIIEITNTSDDSLNIYFRIAYGDNTNQENLMIPKKETRNIRLQHDQNFLYFHHPTTPTKIYTGIVKKNTQSVVIEKINNNSFFVIVNRKNGKPLKHKFYHNIVEGNYEYGNDQTIHLKSADCWYHDTTFDENNIDVVQGDTDFVNQIYAPAGEAFSGEGSYVGEIHGCSLQAYTKFFADGVEFNPMELTSLLLCENFRFVEKVNYYADLADGAVGGVAYPKLTETGEMILSNIHFADAIYRSDGSSSLFNKLTVQRDGTKFTDLYAGWIRGYNSYFDEVVLNNEENTDNEFIYDSGWNVTPLNGSTVDISLINRIKGDNILMIGDRAVVSQNIKMVNRTNLKCSYRTQFYQDSTPSLKIYQVPVITRLSMEVMGEQMETFNQGDTIECYIERKIDMK